MPDFRPIEPAYSVGTNGAIPGRRNAVLAVAGETKAFAAIPRLLLAQHEGVPGNVHRVRHSAL